jgi:hypothetical protein
MGGVAWWESIMKATDGRAFDPEFIEMLQGVLDEAWRSLRPAEQTQSRKTLLAERILKLAATGERDPARLRARALFSVAPRELKAG